ncbi:hypothetical protein V1504DRAFT_460746 [Lipomyces starkeyi]
MVQIHYYAARDLFCAQITEEYWVQSTKNVPTVYLSYSQRRMAGRVPMFLSRGFQGWLCIASHNRRSSHIWCKDSELEIYDGRGHEYPGEGLRTEIGVPVRRTLTFKEILERLRTRYYELEENIAATQRVDSEWHEEVMTHCNARVVEYILNTEREQGEDDERAAEIH